MAGIQRNSRPECSEITGRNGAKNADEDGKDANAVDYSRLVAVLIEAVKEQQVQIKDHEHSLREQKAQVAKLRAEIERLKLSIGAATVR